MESIKDDRVLNEEIRLGFKLKKEIGGKMGISFIFIIGNKKFQKMIFWFKNTCGRKSLNFYIGP